MELGSESRRDSLCMCVLTCVTGLHSGRAFWLELSDLSIKETHLNMVVVGRCSLSMSSLPVSLSAARSQFLLFQDRCSLKYCIFCLCRSSSFLGDKSDKGFVDRSFLASCAVLEGSLCFQFHLHTIIDGDASRLPNECCPCRSFLKRVGMAASHWL